MLGASRTIGSREGDAWVSSTRARDGCGEGWGEEGVGNGDGDARGRRRRRGRRRVAHRVAVQTVFERGTSVGRFEGRAWADGGVVRGVVDVDVGGEEETEFTRADFCQTLDLTKEEDETALSNADVSYATFRNDSIDDDDPWTRCFEFVRAFVRSLKQCEVGRVVVEPETPTDADEWDACVELARALKALMVDANAVCVMILPLVDAPPHASALIRHLVDCAVDVQPLEGPTSEIESLLPEPHTCVGLIAVRKLQFRGGVVSPLTRMDRVYALQMRRKRLAIKPLQIRPEEEKKGDGASGGACGGGKGGGDLDF